MSLITLNKLCNKGTSSLRQKDVANDGPYPVYGASGIVGYSSDYQNEERCVAVIKDGAGVGRAFICEPKSSVLGTIQALLPSEGVDCGYLLHLVRSLKLGDGFTGSTIPHIYFKDYGKRLVVWHAVDEQRRIADTLNAVESQTAALGVQLEKLDDLVKSRFVEMFPPGRYAEEKLGDCLEQVVAGVNVNGQQRPIQPGEYAVLKISAVTKGYFKSDEYKVIDNPDAVTRMVFPRKGDLLFSRANTREMVGATAIVDADYDNLFLPDKLWRLDFKPEVLTIYAKSFLQLGSTRHVLSSLATGTSGSMYNISMKKLRGVMMPLPPIGLQEEFAAFVAQVDKSRFAVQQSVEQLELLKASLMQEYFG